MQKKNESNCFQFKNRTPNIKYTESKVKHHLNIYQEKSEKLSKHEVILVTFMKIDKMVAMYSKFNYHLG